jgi:hypothetical protein
MNKSRQELEIKLAQMMLEKTLHRISITSEGRECRILADEAIELIYKSNHV